MGDVPTVDVAKTPDTSIEVNVTAPPDDESNPTWDVGFGDFIMYNDMPEDKNILRFFQRTKAEVINLLKNALFRKRSLNYNMILQVSFGKKVKYPLYPLKSPYISLENPADIDDSFDVLAALVDLKSNSFSYMYKILRLEVNIRRPVRVLGSFIELPPEVASLGAVINFPNKNSNCFFYAILVGVKHVSKVKTEPLEEFRISDELISFGGFTLDFSGLTYPVRPRDVRIFEKNNPSISVSVFDFQKCSRMLMYLVEPIYQTRQQKETHFNLLFLENLKQNRTHYAYISNLDKLMRNTRRRILACPSTKVLSTESVT